ncbi:MAG: phosphatidylglycerophosphatase A [Candidatus Omnitrophica bacterium]|nr:phosphatidylglycerophosphatase A [Candidatus Omnitrophota bacterium]
MGQSQTDQKFLDRTILALARLGIVGKLPLLGGTAGSLAAAVVFGFFPDRLIYTIGSLIILLVSFPVSSRAEALFGQKDCKEIVIDDFAGALIGFIFLPRTLPVVVIGFCLFRFFDFFKVYPANKIEKLSGGWGVVGDDLIAGIYTNLCLQLLVRIFPQL